MAPRNSERVGRRREASEATPLLKAPRTLGVEARIRAPNAAALSRKLGLFCSSSSFSSSPSFVAAFSTTSFRAIKIELTSGLITR